MWERVCKKSELSAALLQKYVLKNGSVLATLDAFGAVFVFEASCPHAAKTLHQAKWNADTRHLTCLFHWVKFDLADGGKPLTGPTSPPLTVYKTELRFEQSDEIVYIDFHSEP
jgi:nitrite reductase/ring-hydroxylating ferredoxin subunit